MSWAPRWLPDDPFLRVVLILCALLLVAMLAVIVFLPSRAERTEAARESTDTTGRGLIYVGDGVRVDRETGCEYVETASGGITPRLRSDGTPGRGCREMRAP
jgi:hypothetical protein